MRENNASSASSSSPPPAYVLEWASAAIALPAEDRAAALAALPRSERAEVERAVSSLLRQQRKLREARDASFDVAAPGSPTERSYEDLEGEEERREGAAGSANGLPPPARTSRTVRRSVRSTPARNSRKAG